LTTTYAEAFEGGHTVRLAFEEAQRAVHPNKVVQAEILFCYDCLSLDNFSDEFAVLRFLTEKAELTRMQMQPEELEALAVQAEVPAVAKDVELLRLQRTEQMLTELQVEVALLRGTPGVGG